MAFLGWPAFAVSAPRPDQPGPNPDATTITLWWRSADAQALYQRVKNAGVPIVREPVDGPFGRQFTLADPDELQDHYLREGPAVVLATQALIH